MFYLFIYLYTYIHIHIYIHEWKGVTVQAYGTNCALKEVAQVTQKDAKTLRIQIFDPEITSAIDKAIRTAGLGLNPQVERPGILSVPVPRPDQETRAKLVKVCL